MKEELRKSIAFIAGMTIANKNADTLYDYKDTKFFHFSGEHDDNYIKIYDYERECYMVGEKNDEKYNLYDYGENAYIDFEIFENGRAFKGYSYATSSFYEGTVDGNMVEFYDYGTNETYCYNI